MTCQASERVSGFYTGASITANNAEDGGASSSATGLTLSAGYNFSKYVGSEISLFNIGDHKDLGMEGNGLPSALLDTIRLCKISACLPS